MLLCQDSRHGGGGTPANLKTELLYCTDTNAGKMCCLRFVRVEFGWKSLARNKTSLDKSKTKILDKSHTTPQKDAQASVLAADSELVLFPT